MIRFLRAIGTRTNWWAPYDWYAWKSFKLWHQFRELKRTINLRFGRSVRVEVTPEDIELGERAHSERCPVARALSRALGTDLGTVAVYGIRAIGIGGGSWAVIPERVSKKIEAYDKYGVMMPFSFDVRVPRGW